MDDETREETRAKGPDARPSGPGGKKRLGRGLSALIAARAAGEAAASNDASPAAEAASGAADETATTGARLRDLPVDDVAASSRQPRRSFDPDELAELAASIASLGVVQPIVVRPAPSGAQAPWELIAGERRLRAARLAGLESIPALVRPADEAASLEIAPSTRQPRRAFDPDELAELAASIASLGVVQPVVVRPAPGAAAAPWEL
ncbi:MAG TPA: ParB/RepB/Spo0J family partition protein, partial [Thermoleophilia bacterium]|nr:ParB/RepB/Spo0J family partition protein [Thermoleophilia bacterium]